MTRSPSETEIRWLRMRSQRLIGDRPKEARAVVRGVFALQARDAKAARLAIEVQPFEPLGREILPYIEREAEDIGRFLGAAATLTIQD